MTFDSPALLLLLFAAPLAAWAALRIARTGGLTQSRGRVLASLVALAVFASALAAAGPRFGRDEASRVQAVVAIDRSRSVANGGEEVLRAAREAKGTVIGRVLFDGEPHPDGFAVAGDASDPAAALEAA